MKRDLEELEKLDDLVKKGILAEDEFQKGKDRILNRPKSRISGNLFGLDEGTYCFLIHISILLGFVHLILGLIIPIVLWALNKNNNQSVNQHGKNALNWMFSFLLYFVVAMVIVFVMNRVFHKSINYSFDIRSPISLFTGFVPISILMLLNVLFILMGAIKASLGVLWEYPLSIKFIR